MISKEKKQRKSLQKVTNTEGRITLLLQKERVTQDDVNEILKPEDEDTLNVMLRDKLTHLKGEDLDQFIQKISAILPQTTKNQLYESNHFRISQAISILVEDMGKMPSVNMIAEECGLSRTTIYKHLRSYSTHPLYQDEITKFRFMVDRVLSKVLRMAVQGSGNVKAARLYLEMMGYLGKGSTTVNNHTNYIQVNQFKVTQERIEQLPQDQRTKIEEILKGFITPQLQK